MENKIKKGDYVTDGNEIYYVYSVDKENVEIEGLFSGNTYSTSGNNLTRLSVKSASHMFTERKALIDYQYKMKCRNLLRDQKRVLSKLRNKKKRGKKTK